MLLERRVSRFDPWPDPGFCAALSDELRKSFIKLVSLTPSAAAGRPVHSLSGLTLVSNSKVLNFGLSR
jgi:hypothetical protein